MKKQKYWKNICKMQKKQVKKGLKHYGQLLEDNHSLSEDEIITMAQEELIDALMYLEHKKAETKRNKKKNKKH